MIDHKAVLYFFLLCLNWNLINGVPLTDIQNGNISEYSDLASDLENWMSKLPNNLRTVSIKNLAIPGTHDSFTSDITAQSDVSPDGVEILQILGKLKTAKLVISNWSKAQGLNVIGQLQAGIRFFDLRFCRNSDNEKLYFCHAMYSSEIQGVITDLASFLSSHPQEVVILDCQHFYDFTAETHNKVIQLMKDTLGDKLVPYQSNMDSLTLEYLASQNKQVILVYRDSSQSGQNLLWPSDSFPTPWYDTMDSSKLIPDLNNGISNRSPDVGYISQCILTPQVSDILAGLLSSLKKKCAVDFESARTNWISSQTPGQRGVNIIINDFIELSDNLFSKTVINLNTKLTTEHKGFLGKMKWYVHKIKGWF